MVAGLKPEHLSAAQAKDQVKDRPGSRQGGDGRQRERISPSRGSWSWDSTGPGSSSVTKPW
jgi:hypothetical protein